jgi:hypothetical protein
MSRPDRFLGRSDDLRAAGPTPERIFLIQRWSIADHRMNTSYSPHLYQFRSIQSSI